MVKRSLRGSNGDEVRESSRGIQGARGSKVRRGQGRSEYLPAGKVTANSGTAKTDHAEPVEILEAFSNKGRLSRADSVRMDGGFPRPLSFYRGCGGDHGRPIWLDIGTSIESTLVWVD